MALQAFMPLNSIQRNSLSVVKFSPKLGVHHFPSSSNTVKRTLKACLPAKISKENVRPVVNFPPSVWKDLDFSKSNHQDLESNEKQIGELKRKVKGMLMAPSNDLVQKVGFIDSICRLGVSYHFETEIEEQLNHIFEALQLNLADDNEYDLYTVALLFRVFRQHGYKVSCDVLKKFKDSDGKFKESLTCDVRGMLSLYEATHLIVHGEDTLGDALAFTTAHLKSFAGKSSSHLAEQVIKALEMPFHKGVPRVEARKYISLYEEDLESRNETLLVFAKLDFNRVQLLHQQELSHLLSWWRNLKVASTLSYARDRIVEVYLWTVATSFEPCYSKQRLISTQAIIMVSLVDDTFDAYGTLEELENFSDAIQRWDISALDQLPDYMKFLYKVLLDLFDDFYNDAIKEGRSDMVLYAQEKLKEMVRAYLTEAQWHNKGYIPSFDEYLDNGLITAGQYSFPAIRLLGTEEIAGINAIEWLESRPKIVRAAYVLVRLMDDVESHEAEQKRERGHVASGVECLMNQHSISREEAIEKLNIIFEDAWKDINEACMRPREIPIKFLIPHLNFARFLEFCYNEGDGYTNPEYLKDFMTKLFIDKVPI